MSKEIRLKMPDEMYNQMQDHAEKTNLPLDTYILEILVNSFENDVMKMELYQVNPLPDSDVDREKVAYHQLHQSLWEKYPGQHVAIYNGELVDHDTDGLALSKRVYKRFQDQFVLIRKVEREADPVLQFRSPRFEGTS